MICDRTLDKLVRDIKRFHGFVAPGLMIGAYMVDLAYKNLPNNVEADVIVETRHCLPDAVQIFTPCTVGNGWMKILDLDKFALTFYDRHTYEGVRVWLDLDKAENHPNVYNWFMGRVSKKDLPADVLNSSIVSAGTDILSFRHVKVTQHNTREKKGKIKVCPICREAYAAAQGEACQACQGQGYYAQATETLMTS